MIYLTMSKLVTNRTNAFTISFIPLSSRTHETSSQFEDNLKID